MVTISAIAYAVRTASASTPNKLKLSQAQQLVAAALGYKSLAAYQASENEVKDLGESAHFVLDTQLLHSRSADLELPHKLTDLALLLEAAFKERHPTATLYGSDSELDSYVRDMVQDVVLNNGNTAGALAMTNNDGIDEIYLPFEDIVMDDLPLDDVQDSEFNGHVTVIPDIERPYSGHKIDVKARIIIERKGRTCIAEPACEVIHSRLNYNWNGDEEDDSEEERNKVSLAEALADELGLELTEAEELVDSDFLIDDSDDGLVYRYVYDFTYAPPAIAAKLMAKYRTLQVEVPSWFFDRVRRSED